MKRFYLFCWCVFIFLFVGAVPLSANTSPTIKIDGQPRMFDPPCQIVDGRTMIPVRYVIEDSALQGIVTWNADSSEVDIVCKNKHFVFKIASHTVIVDGEYIDLDVVPYIYQNRTYIPLRFFAEQLSAQVTWNTSVREVSIDFKPKKSEVFAYYYYRAFDEFQANADSITDVALRWFETNANGDLFYEYQDDYNKVLQFARDNNIKTHASVVFMDKDDMHALLSDPARRQYLVKQLSEQVKQNDYDGVNIDFEFLGQGDRDNFTLFLQELKQSLGNDKQLSVALSELAGRL
ncbi:MAG: glycosyl hydrolase-like protein [Firmicutes bacterium]|nr:glycosyl hydrolase-like protein [Bacillota bacterium]